jgi:predicted extracellular nuclease
LSGRRLRFAAFLVAAFVATVAGGVQQAGATSDHLVISQLYGAGGNSGATLTNDYIELFNRGSDSVSLAGMSLQYTSSNGTGLFGSSDTLITPLPNVSVDSGHYFLVRESGAGAATSNVPADYTDDSGITMAATSGKVALVSDATPLGCNGGSTPCSTTQLARIVDLVGYGPANFFEGKAPAPAPSTTTADFRANGGCADTDDNGADFTTAAPAPRTSATTHACVATTPTDPSGTGSVTPNTVVQGGAVTVAVSVTPGTNPTSTGLTVSADLTLIGGSATQTLFDDGTNGDLTAGDNTFTYATTVAPATGQGLKNIAFSIADVQNRSASGVILLGVTESVPDTIAIHDIQGSAHRSPLLGQAVTGVHGIVTAKLGNGYYMQDPSPDANEATSEGIFVFTSSAPTVNVGDAVSVNGRVQEFRPANAATNLTQTELSSPVTTTLSSGNPLPAATVVGTGGRIPPDSVIEDDATGDVETSGTFDPASDGLDFWESVEGMRVKLNNPVAVGPTNAFGETAVVGDDGANASVRTPRGGILLRPNDGNPERIVLADSFLPNLLPTANVGDHYQGSVEGIVDYNFGLFMLELTAVPTVVHDGVTPETTAAPGAHDVSIATFNFENLDPTDPQSKFDRLAGILVHNLQSPDIVSGEEVQDDTGPVDHDGVVSANATLDELVAAIEGQGGPHYQYRYINPVADQDGGEPGGNIRQVFLFRTDRGVSFVDRPGGGSTTATTVVNGANGPELSASPGRIDPTNGAFATSRKPLAGEFVVRGQHLFVISNHFNSKGGDDPLTGRFQPPTRSSEAQRHQQAQIVHDFVAQILSADPNANVVVAGDLNDFEFSDTVSILKGTLLQDLIDTLPLNERYSYVFEGNSQTLDHVLSTPALLANPHAFDVVHVNAEFADQASDHDPAVLRLTLNARPIVAAGGPYSVAEGASTQLSATGSDPDGDALTYAWDLDGNGTFETPGQTVTFAAADGPATPTVAVRATDTGGLTATAPATVSIANVAPTVTALVPSPANTLVGEPVVFNGSATDPSAVDAAAGFAWAFDAGAGLGPFGSNGFTRTYSACGTYGVSAEARDKDGGISDPLASPSVHVYDAAILAPLTTGAFNVVQKGRTVPVKLAIGCNGFLGGLQPAISIRAGEYDPSVDPADPSYDVPDSSSAADTSGLMRESGGQYIYNLGLPSTAASGQVFTVLIRPFGGSATLYAVLKVK